MSDVLRISHLRGIPAPIGPRGVSYHLITRGSCWAWLAADAGLSVGQCSPSATASFHKAYLLPYLNEFTRVERLNACGRPIGLPSVPMRAGSFSNQPMMGANAFWISCICGPVIMPLKILPKRSSCTPEVMYCQR